jgi:hypothetical protein
MISDQHQHHQQEDQTLTCKDCHQPFLLTAKECEFYVERRLELPKRCKACRQLRKVAKGKES